MNDEFEINSERLVRIAEAFHVSMESVEKLHSEFEKLRAQIKDHYLAHISRVLEVYFKEKTGNKEFFIECKPFRVNAPGQRAVSFCHRFQRFAINYDSG
jgi:hypothetical protein